MTELRSKLSCYAGYLHLFCALWVVATQIFPFEYQRLALIGFATSYIIDYVFERRWSSFKWDKAKWVYVAMCVYYLLIPLWNLWAETQGSTPHYADVLGKRVPFLAIGIIGLLGVSDKLKLRYFAFTIVLTSLFAIAYLVGKVGFGEFLVAPDRLDLFVQARIAHLGTHMLFNIYLNVSVVFILYLYLQRLKRKWLYLLLGVIHGVILLVLLTTDGRVGFITAVLLHALCMLYAVWRWKRVLFKYGVVLITVGSVFVATTHERISLKRVMSDARAPIWRVASDMILEKPLLGYGVQDARSKFIVRGKQDADFTYWFKSKVENISETEAIADRRTHPHNAYLESVLEFGIVGFLLWLFLFVFPLLVVVPERRIYLFLFLSVFALQMLFEVVGTNTLPFLHAYGLLLWLSAGLPQKKSIPTDPSEEQSVLAS